MEFVGNLKIWSGCVKSVRSITVRLALNGGCSNHVRVCTALQFDQPHNLKNETFFALHVSVFLLF